MFPSGKWERLPNHDLSVSLPSLLQAVFCTKLLAQDLDAELLG